ncbi:MAG: DUF3837 domain-containing protein [Blautia sp.]|nr:DUF3837 domain-containing protein [Blautia sp.]MCM1200346.1 DUF3837 domain-containing protein [Bacteroides fragilis]
MVTSLARQAVIIKSGNDTSILTGNYELAYALGFLANQMELSISENDVNVQELHQQVVEALKNKTMEDEKIKRLFRMVRLYSPAAEWDGQMRELLHTGLTETCPWDLYHAG